MKTPSIKHQAPEEVQSSISKRRQLFIEALAEFLAGDLARKSIDLERRLEYARNWAELFNASGLRGWVTVKEAKAYLEDLL